jgi:hypothetical protein
MDKDFEADTFFPAIDYGEWDEISHERPDHGGKVDFNFEYIVLQRKN